MPGPAIFGTAPDGSEVLAVEITRGGTSARVLTWGATLQDFRIAAAPRPLILGSSDFAAYLGPMRYFGAVVGRVANRIAGGRATLDGTEFRLDRNEAGRTTLHGGATGTSQRNWRLEEAGEDACRLSLTLEDGADGFPGRLEIGATYALDAEGALSLVLEARTDRPGFCNLAHHGYWSLDGRADIAAHRLTIAAGRYLPVDAALIPAGPPAPVAGTGFDFRAPRAPAGPGTPPLDHNFCLGEAAAPGLRPACTLAAGGLRLDIATTELGLQVYDGAGIDTQPFAGHSGRPYGAHAGLALEPQGWPDAPNRPDFPPVVLRPGETYRQHSRFHARPDAAAQTPRPEETT